MSSTPYLAIEGQGEVYFIGAVSRWHWASLEAMFEWLEARWIITDGDPERLLQEPEVRNLMQRILNLCPRLDLPGVFGCPIAQLEQATLVKLFFGDQNEMADLTKLQLYTPLETQPWRLDSENEPIPNTDDPDMDLLASLSAAFSPTDALLLLKTLAPRQIDRLLWETAEIQRDPKERAQESLGADFAAWKDENRDQYRDSLGLKFQYPVDSTSDKR